MADIVPGAAAAQTPSTSRFAWQGFQLHLPPGWNPVRLQGSYQSGQALIADLHGPRLGLRWRSAERKKLDARAWARRAIKAEVGAAAASRAKPITLSAESQAQFH